MPKNPTMDQRIKRNIAHQENCGCREIPPTVKKAIETKKSKLT